MYQPLIKFHPHPAIITQVLRIFVEHRSSSVEPSRKCKFRLPLHSPFAIFVLKNNKDSDTKQPASLFIQQ